MDVAYDHIQEESYPEDEPQQPKDGKEEQPQPSEFNKDVQEAFKAISNSPWAARLGGLWGTVRKQGEHYYEEASKEYTAASQQASKGISSIISHTRSLSLKQPSNNTEGSSSKEGVADASGVESHPDRPDSLPADIVKEAEGILARLRDEAAKRLKDIERAEDAADEALLKFGTNIQNFLRDAVTIAPPDEHGDKNGEVLFESKDQEGKRVIHTSRLEAQLHVIHSNLDSFIKDPISPEWASWGENFDATAFTDTIAKDLEQYDGLRRAMEKLVPERVEYATFWKRYYFLRHIIDTEEVKRKELLKKASANTPDEEDIAWDEDSDDEESSTPNPPLAASKETLKPTSEDQPQQQQNQLQPTKSEPGRLKPESPRRSHDQHSQAGSDASYDLVSGASSRAPGSPRDAKKGTLTEESDEEDWE